jgi:periplasmic protein TonB
VVIVLHALVIGGLMAYKVSPRFEVPEEVIEASLVPQSPTEDNDPMLPRVVDWQPVLPEVLLPQVVMTEVSTAITLPPPRPTPPAAVAERVADGEATPLLDAQSVGYLVPPAPRYPPASRRLREEGEVLVRVLIDADGRPVELNLLRSSGHSRLDDAALSAVRAAIFRPYVSSGRARAAYVRVPVEFALRRS